jgi:hypothetical protein
MFSLVEMVLAVPLPIPKRRTRTREMSISVREALLAWPSHRSGSRLVCLSTGLLPAAASPDHLVVVILAACFCPSAPTEYGMAHIVVFNTETDFGNGLVGPEELGGTSGLDNGPFGSTMNQQIEFLKQDLAHVDRKVTRAFPTSSRCPVTIAGGGLFCSNIFIFSLRPYIHSLGNRRRTSSVSINIVPR